ncbi:MAG: tyrosine-type recombinase/integrase [Pseudomonadales bacterium]|nr:tyrosine-type recombinase/integrase [Pseudomonadales bacterium]
MTKIPTSPQPLFDTLENLKLSLGQPTVEPISIYFQSSQILKADEDYRHANEFLYSYRGSKDTFASYRREVERLLQWSWFINKTSLNELKRLDIESFIDFCQSPPLSWIGLKSVSRFINRDGQRISNPEWRPFIVKTNGRDNTKQRKDFTLSAKALQAIFSILSSFFTYLVQEEYIENNPIALIRQKSKYLRKYQQKPKIRRLTELQWGYVIDTAEIMAQSNPLEHERTLFIIQALYGMYLRISELAASTRWTPEMGDFHMDMDGNWWFTTVGKGNKERDISVSDAMLAALKRYRRYIGLSPLPTPGEANPLIPKTRGRGVINSTRQIRNIVQKCFDLAIDRLGKDGFEQDAGLLRAATVHWLRHTGISDDVKHRPREHVRDDAGHGSSAITDKYIDVEMRERHKSGKNKLLKP